MPSAFTDLSLRMPRIFANRKHVLYNGFALKQEVSNMEIAYVKCGDYYIPDLTLPEKTRPIGK